MMVLMMSLLHQVGKMYHAPGMLFGADILILVSIYDPLPMNNAHRRFSAMTISCIVSVCRRRRRSHATSRHAARASYLYNAISSVDLSYAAKV